jgi:Family of unknown function (DUF5829)
MRRFLVLTLTAAAAAWAGEPLPPVYFNHVTIFLDPAAYKAIATAPILTELAGFSESTAQRDGGTWGYTGLYVRGQRTYLEFMQAGEGRGAGPAGSLSFGMWVDDRSKLPLVRDSLAKQMHSQPQIAPSTNFVNGRDITWFDALSATDPRDRSVLIRTWIMSLYPEYPRQRYPDLKPEEDGTTREKRGLRQYVADRYLHDVTRFAFTVNDKEQDELIKEFRAYGYSVRNEGASQIVTGPEIEFVLLPTVGPSARKLAISLSLNRAKTGEQQYRFGDGSELRFFGKGATWYFPAGWRP